MSYTLACSQQPCEIASHHLTRCLIVNELTLARIEAVVASISFTWSCGPIVMLVAITLAVTAG